MIENECKTPYRYLVHSFSIKNIFYDKMDLRLSYFDKAICFENLLDCNAINFQNQFIESFWTVTEAKKRPVIVNLGADHYGDFQPGSKFQLVKPN